MGDWGELAGGGCLVGPCAVGDAMLAGCGRGVAGAGAGLAGIRGACASVAGGASFCCCSLAARS